MSDYFPIRAAAKWTGLSIDTLRAWERRYKAVVPERSDRGRQYSREQLHRLSLLRELVERGHGIGQIAGLPDDDLHSLLRPEAAAAAAVVGPTRAIAAPVLEALLDFRYGEANGDLGRLAALLTPRELVYGVVLPLMREAGERTHGKEMGVAQEHLVSAALRNVLGSVMRLYPSRRGAPLMLLTTLSGELHEFGVLAACMIATIAGMDTLPFGPNLPPKELALVAAKTGADYVVIGCAGDGTQAADVAELAAGLPAETELWIGGERLPQMPERSAGRMRVFADMESFENECRLIVRERDRTGISWPEEVMAE